MVDIAPEQYQKLRQEFLDSLTVDMLNQYLRQQLSQDMALVLQQPQGEPEYNMKDLKATWERLMMPAPARQPAAARLKRITTPRIFLLRSKSAAISGLHCVTEVPGGGVNPARATDYIRHRS